MFQKNISGSNREMGQEIGNYMHAASSQLPPLLPGQESLLAACQNEFHNHLPELEEELLAFAEAAGIDSELLFGLLFINPLAQNTPSGSILAVLPERTLA